MKNKVYHHIEANAAKGKKQYCLLIDPDKYNAKQVEECIFIANNAKVDLIFVGGSLLTQNRAQDCVRLIKELTAIPVVLFPGSPAQICEEADALLFLSLISGRNADLLIGRHVEAAPFLKKSGLEVIPTGYMLIDGGRATTVSYISNTIPIPADKPDIAACTALAGEMLGLKLIYMDSGSGAAYPIPPANIELVKNTISTPLIVGGGIHTKQQMLDACTAGADVIVVGNAIEKDRELIYTFADVLQGFN